MQNLDGLLPTGWTRHRARRRGAAGRWGAGAHRRGRWCAGLGAGALGWALGAGREGVWQAAGRAGRALGAARHGRCRQRARGPAPRGVGAGRRRGVQAWGARQAGRRRWARAGHAAGARPGRWARGRALGTRQAGAGRAGRARPGRLGWPWAVHSVHSAHFRSVLTRFFPESPNEHRSL